MDLHLPTHTLESENEIPFFTPFIWLKKAKIYNKDLYPISNDWLISNCDVLVLYFSQLEADTNEKNIQEFCYIYESVKHNNVPIEVINIPMDENKDDMFKSFKSQANWFTLMYDDPQIITLKYLYDVTCVPHLIVTKVDGSMISSNGILDIQEYGKNAVISWLCTPSMMNKNRNLNKEAMYYGKMWHYMKGTTVNPRGTCERRVSSKRNSLRSRLSGKTLGRAASPPEKPKLSILSSASNDGHHLSKQYSNAGSMLFPFADDSSMRFSED